MPAWPPTSTCAAGDHKGRELTGSSGTVDAEGSIVDFTCFASTDGTTASRFVSGQTIEAFVALPSSMRAAPSRLGRACGVSATTRRATRTATRAPKIRSAWPDDWTAPFFIVRAVNLIVAKSPLTFGIPMPTRWLGRIGSSGISSLASKFQKICATLRNSTSFRPSFPFKSFRARASRDISTKTS